MILTVLVATVAIDAAARSWLSRTIDHDPVALGPVVLHLHRHVSAAFGFTSLAPPLVMMILAGVAGAAALELCRRSIVRSSGPTGLFVGGAVGYIVDSADDGAITEYFEIGPLPAVGVAGLAIASGVIGELLDRWARNGEVRPAS